ncbi:MAG: PAS domain-containing sensor histidine kinase [Acidimicrobiia bacterium]|nr:PAS domain-containing sensor histidine kinase [Acidimicrobiia bacterium]
MAVASSITSTIWRQRVQVRLFGYGAAATALILSWLAGRLDRPALPIAVALFGLLFAVPARKHTSTVFTVAVIFDAVAVIVLALVAGSWLVGGLALFTGAVTYTIGRTPRSVLPVAVVGVIASLILVLGETGVVARPAFIPRLDPPADVLTALSLTVVLSVAGIAGVRKLLGLYGLASVGVEEGSRRWWRAMEDAEEAILVVVDDRVTHSNRAAETLMQTRRVDLEGQHISNLVPDDRTIRRDDGTEAHLDVITTPIAMDGRLAEVVFLRDISLQENNRRRLEQTVADTERFVASVSHEVRTPLTAVVGLSAVADENWDELDQAELHELISVVAAQSKEVSNIIEDLLVAARARTAGLRVRSEAVDAATTVTEVIAGMADRAGHVTQSGAGMVRGDAGRIRQIVRNLLTNALKYGGPTVGVEIVPSGETTEICVFDNGPAIPETLREQIFEPFTRATESAGSTDSIGLGLAVSRQLAMLMNGSLTYDHRNGLSRFRLVLPSV